ncbi:unnamed protein product, partial [Rotaria magnacalcarata]
KNRLERLSTLDHSSFYESNKHVSSSVATTVKKFFSRKSSNIIEYVIRPHQLKLSMKCKPIVNPFNSTFFSNNDNNNNNNYNGQQAVLTSSDIEAMTLRQFRMSSLCC